MNVKRPLNIALATSIALMSVGCKAQHSTGILESLQTNKTQTIDGSTIKNEINPQSRYEITFTKFYIEEEDDSENGQSDYLFYVYNPEKRDSESEEVPYEYKCFNDVKDCNNKVYAKKDNTVFLNVKVSDFAINDYVYLMVLEADLRYWNVLDQTPNPSEINSVNCPFSGKDYDWTCLKIPVQYLYKNRYSCLTMETERRNDKICLYYNIKKQQKLQSEFQSNLEKLSPFFENNLDFYISEEEFDFSGLPEVTNQFVSSVTFYANEVKASGLPTKIAQPVVDYLSQNYPSGLWVINGADGALAAYGADQLTKNASSISINVTWPPEISDESINNWLKTPEKGQVYRPYHTLRLYYKKGQDIIAKPVTGLNDTVKTVNETLTLPGRYTLEKHINKVEVELSGIFSLLKSKVDGTSITLTPEYRQEVNAQLKLPDGNKYSCQSISKTVPEWFKTNTIMLQCPRLPKSLIEPDFVDGKVQVDAHLEKLQLGLRFKNRDHQGKPSLKDWCINNPQICLTKEGNQGYMLVNARDLPKNSQLTLVPPKSAFSIFYLNEPITVELSEEQQDYLYTANSVPELNGSAAINLEVQNPKERPIETFKDSDNPWTPEELTFLCDGSQSNTALCGKTCTLKTTTERVGLICEGQKQMINMSLKELKGYLMTSRFLGERWNTNPVKLEGQSLTDFFCGAWQRLFPVDNQVIVVGDDKNSVQMAYFTNLFNNQQISQKLLLSAVTANQQSVWSYSIKPGEKGDSLMNSVIWQLDSVQGRYDYYLHQASGCQSNGQPLSWSIRSETVCNSPSSQQSRCQRSNIPSVTGQQSYGNAGQIAQIDIVAVFAEKYNFQQQVVISPISLNLGLNIPETGAQLELRAGWMRTWNKQATQSSLRDAINKASQQRNPSVKLHYLYDDQNDREDKWLWSPMPGQAHLDNAPSITTRQDMAKVVDISNVVLENDILPVLRSLDDQVTKIIDHITRQWQPNGDYLLVILSDGISEQEMKQLNKNMLPRGNGKRQLLVLTSDFLPTDSQSLMSLPKLPSNTGDTVISMYDKDWIEKFVKAIFKF